MPHPFLPYPGYFGTPFYTQANPSAPTRNNGGTVLGVSAASLQNSRVTTNGFGWPYLGIHNAYNDNKPNLSNTGNYSMVVRANSAGAFANMVKGQYIIMTMCNQITGITNTILNSPGNYNKKSQAVASKWRNSWLKRTTGGWYYQSGQPVNAQYSRDAINNEAATSYGAPGRITFAATGTAIPSNTQAYQKKTD